LLISLCFRQRQNSHDVVVGQLIGDGLFIQLEADGEQAKITSPNAVWRPIS
jgi:hypothetical protein